MDKEIDTRPDLDRVQRQCRAESAHIDEIRHVVPPAEDDGEPAIEKEYQEQDER